jgi:hypothetical protein
VPLLLDISEAERAGARTLALGRLPVRIGSGEACEVRLEDAGIPDVWVSLEEVEKDWVLVDKGGEPRVLVDGAPVGREKRRIVRHGSVIAGGRFRLSLRDEATALPEIAQANTAELALRMAGQAVRRGKGVGEFPTVRVVEGMDFGRRLPLAEEGHDYFVGRAKSCALPLADLDVSREHARIVRRGARVLVRDLGSRQGVWMGTKRLDGARDAVWPRGRAVRVGQTVLMLEASADEFFEESSEEVLGQAAALETPAPVDPAAEEPPVSATEEPPVPRPPPAPHATPGARALHIAFITFTALLIVLSLAATVWFATR